MSKSIYPATYSKDHLINLYSNYTDDYSDLDDNLYCVYLVVNLSDKLPPYYIGSSMVKNIKAGYMGTVSSKKFKNIYKEELKTSPHLFKMIILDTYTSRKEALEEENWLQHLHNAVKSINFINMGYATKNGAFGNDVVSGLIWINKNNIEQYIHPLELETKLSDGWVVGRLKRSDISKKRQSESISGEKNHFFGRKHSTETLLKMKRTEEQRSTLSKNHLGVNNPAFGRKWYKHPTLERKLLLPEEVDEYIKLGYVKGFVNPKHQVEDVSPTE